MNATPIWIYVIHCFILSYDHLILPWWRSYVVELRGYREWFLIYYFAIVCGETVLLFIITFIWHERTWHPQLERTHLLGVRLLATSMRARSRKKTVIYPACIVVHEWVRILHALGCMEQYVSCMCWVAWKSIRILHVLWCTEEYVEYVSWYCKMVHTNGTLRIPKNHRADWLGTNFITSIVTLYIHSKKISNDNYKSI